MSVFEGLVWVGSAVTLFGLALLVSCIVKVARLRSAELSEEQKRTALAQVVPLNLGALLLSVLGLILVVIGVFLN